MVKQKNQSGVGQNLGKFKILPYGNQENSQKFLLIAGNKIWLYDLEQEWSDLSTYIEGNCLGTAA